MSFDETGVCNVCRIYERLDRARPTTPEQGRAELARIADDARARGRGRDYECVVGVSGGVDSTYTALMVKRELGLRPLAVHLDNGWNSEMAVGNIEITLRTLGIDLYTHVINWNEFRDLQLSYFKAGVVDLEIPTDHAIIAALFHAARRVGVRYIFTGHNVVSEGYLPQGWVHHKLDVMNLRAIHRRFGSIPLRTYPQLTLWQYLYYTRGLKMQMVRLLDYIPYVKTDAIALVERELGWRDHGGKHFESIFTRFYQSYVLPEKFGIDKRRAHLSTLVCSGQITREGALEQLRRPPYPTPEMKQRDREYVLKKLGFTEATFAEYLARPRVPHEQFASYTRWHRRLRPAIRAVKMLSKFRRAKGE